MSLLDYLFLAGFVVIFLALGGPQLLRVLFGVAGKNIKAGKGLPGVDAWQLELIKDVLVEKRTKEAKAKLLEEVAEAVKVD